MHTLALPSPTAGYVHLICALAILVVFGSSGCGPGRVPFLFVLPDGFKGEVIVEHDQSLCEPLGLRDGSLIVHIDDSGRACTSTDLPVGFSWEDKFQRGDDELPLVPVSSRGDGVRVRGFWSATFRSLHGEHEYLCFYVGSDEEFLTRDEEMCNPEEMQRDLRELEIESLIDSKVTMDDPETSTLHPRSYSFFVPVQSR